MTKTNDIKDQVSPSTLASPYALASGLLWTDRFLLIPWYLALVLPEFLGTLFDHSATAYTRLVDSAFELLFLWWVGRRHLQRLSRSPSSAPLSCFILFLILGSAFSVIPSIPLLSMSAGLSPQLQMVLIFTSLASCILAYLYFFWFFPFQAGIRSIGAALRMTRSFTAQDWKAPFKVILAPMGLMLLIQGLLSIPAPDGRVIELTLLSTLMSGIYWCLSSYLGLSFALTMLSEKDWHELNLDSYRQSRFTTMAVASPGWLEKLLGTSIGFQVTVLCLLVWVANSVRMASVPPAPTITIESAHLQDKKLTVQLNLHDHKYLFHGFRPAFFRLAGAQRTVVSPFPDSVWIQGEDPINQRLLSLPHDRESLSLMIEFRTSVPSEELRKATDLFLWYGGVRLMQVSLGENTTDASTPK